MKPILLSALIATFFLGAAPSFALEVGDAAPCVELQDIQPDNAVISHCIRTKNDNNSFVLLEFFSTTCSDCAENLPKLSALSQEIAGTTTTRLVGIDRDAQAVPGYVAAHRDLIHFPAAIDSDRMALRAYGVDSTPTTFILNSSNQVIYKNVEVFTDSEIAKIKSLVQKNN